MSDIALFDPENSIGFCFQIKKLPPGQQYRERALNSKENLPASSCWLLFWEVIGETWDYPSNSIFEASPWFLKLACPCVHLGPRAPLNGFVVAGISLAWLVVALANLSRNSSYLNPLLL